VDHISLFQTAESRPQRILALGAHCDDIEIGCGGTLLRLCSEDPSLEVTWVVFTSTAERAAEAQASAADFLAGVATHRVVIKEHRDGFLPYSGAAVKDDFEQLKREVAPDLVFTHYRDDRHQDHRLISELTWNTWRNNLILEYEIPKYDGDLGSPNAFSHLSAAVVERKIDLVLEHYGSQRTKHWLNRELLGALPRVRGMESVAPERLAEGFYCRKLVF